MSDTVIVVQDIVNRFGEQVVHDGVSFEVNAGEIFGIVGGSGSGKSVLLKTMLGLRRPNEGTVTIEGREITAMGDRELREVKRRYGVTFQQGALFTSLNVAENITLPVVEVLDLDDAALRALVELRLRMVGLPLEAAAKFPAQLSGGMVKRAALARSLALDPSILFLDEPTSGLDTPSAVALRAELVRLAGERGVTVFLTTHNLTEAENLCDQVGVIRNGRLIAVGPPRALRERGGRQVEITGDGFAEPLVDGLRRQPGVQSVEAKHDRVVVMLGDGARVAPLVTMLVQGGAEIEEVRKDSASLEEVFLTLMEEK
jgi:phospholipid/cholesterol/gamma-HCH transport system ATP-binding protein